MISPIPMDRKVKNVVEDPKKEIFVRLSKRAEIQ
jgi:hypothetical protein